jgi:hypothetical protein
VPPNKRRSKPAQDEHRGRVTVHHDPNELPRATPRPVTRRTDRPRIDPQPTSRYTPPAPKVLRMRPTWHRVVGAAIMIVGVAIAITNDLIFVGASRSPLPGGHSELYLILALAVAGYGTWWFGWFDRSK